MFCLNKKNDLLNDSFFACTAYLLKGKAITSDDIVECCSEITDPVVRQFLVCCLQLNSDFYVPEYIEVIIQLYYEKIDKNTLVPEALETLVILKSIFIPVIVKLDYQFFHEIYSHLCPAEVRDRIMMLLKIDPLNS